MAPKRNTAKSPFEISFDEAQDLQQRAERRGGDYFEKAAVKFQEALNLSSNADPVLISDCHMGLAETLQNWADNIIQTCDTLPDNQLTIDLERSKYLQASSLYQQAAQHYLHVYDETPPPPPPLSTAAPSSSSSPSQQQQQLQNIRVDALVNMGNTLSSWSEILMKLDQQNNFEQASNVLSQAEACYSVAITKEEDAAHYYHMMQTWTNAADVFVAHAELLCSKPSKPSTPSTTLVDQGREMFQRAHTAYTTACTLSSSEQGDDLPGLLLNWGSALVTAAEHAETIEHSIQLIEDAIRRLKESIGFNRGDPSVFVALGDAYVAMAECIEKKVSNTTMSSGNTTTNATNTMSVDSINVLQQIHAMYEHAVNDGYSLAMKIRSNYPDAVIGIAEVRAQQAKLFKKAGEADLSHAGWHAAIEMYEEALKRPETLGSFHDRNTNRYNYVCCLVQCGDQGRQGQAVELIKQLVGIGAVTMEDVMGDEELSSIVGYL